MSALPVHDIFEALHDAGLSVSLAPDGGLGVAPASRLTPDLRELVKGNKAALVDWLHAANDPLPDTTARPERLARVGSGLPPAPLRLLHLHCRRARRAVRPALRHGRCALERLPRHLKKIKLIVVTQINLCATRTGQFLSCFPKVIGDQT